MGYLILKTLLLKEAIPNGSSLEGVFFLSGTWRSGSQQALIKEDEDPYLDGI